MKMWQAPVAEQRLVTVKNRHADAQWTFQAEAYVAEKIYPWIDGFSNRDLQMEAELDSTISSCLVAVHFLDFLAQQSVLTPTALRPLITKFEQDFLSEGGVHGAASNASKGTAVQLLKMYYSCLHHANVQIKDTYPVLLEEARQGSARLSAIFGGQGPANLTCLEDIREQYTIYEPLVRRLVHEATELLAQLAARPCAHSVHQRYNFRLLDWVRDPQEAPPVLHLALAPVSCPLITLLSIMHYLVLMKTLGLCPGRARALFGGVTGHSLGVFAAQVMSRSDSWESFYKSALYALELSFWVGLHGHQDSHFPTLPREAVAESIEHGEGQPGPMLRVRGLPVAQIRKAVGELNHKLEQRLQVHVAIINTRTTVVLAGPPSTLKSVSLRLRQLSAQPGADQTRILFNKRKPIIECQFLPISAAFHSPFLRETVGKIVGEMNGRLFPGDAFGPAFHHTKDGKVLGQSDPLNVTETLIRMVTVDPMDWPKSIAFAENSYVLDFGPGLSGVLVQKILEGTRTKVILASEWTSMNKFIGNKFDIYVNRPALGPDWGREYKPALQKRGHGSTISTRMTRLLGCPPVMVAGMTPTTVSWKFVSAVLNAGYHAELAGGGYHDPVMFEEAIHKLCSSIPPWRAVCCNLIYADPKAMGWQVPLVRKMIAKGYPIHGLTIGAGIPSAEIIADYVQSVGLRYLGLKPGSAAAIRDVVRVAQQHPEFPFILQWTGGRSGGHHSFEDFHQPLLDTYGRIRQCQNIVLVVGGGFGNGKDTYQYLSGDWSLPYSYPKMPVDGILLGSRVMVAKEARTSPRAKQLITEAKGTGDTDWHQSYQKPVGGVVTITSEMGHPIHVLATRGALLWKELDQTLFGIKEPKKRRSVLEAKRAHVIARLDADFQKPWFPRDCNGCPCELEEMTYLDVLHRMAELMYVSSQKHWIDKSYADRFSEFVERMSERLTTNKEARDGIDGRTLNPFAAVRIIAQKAPEAASEFVHADDISFFLNLCVGAGPGRKPVNFIARLDERFETWFKKDSLWQSENLEAVVDQDPQRVIIIHGPVAAGFSVVSDEPVKTILDSIVEEQIASLQACLSKPLEQTLEQSVILRSGRSLDTVEALRGTKVETGDASIRYTISAKGPLPRHNELIQHLRSNLRGCMWALACLTEPSIFQNGVHRPNPIRLAFTPFYGEQISVCFNQHGAVARMSISKADGTTDQQPTLMNLTIEEGNVISVALTVQDPLRQRQLSLSHVFKYLPPSGWGCGVLIEDVRGREARIQQLYAQLWLGEWPQHVKHGDIRSGLVGSRITIPSSLGARFSKVVASETALTLGISMDAVIWVVWEALVTWLLSSKLQADLSRLLHQSIDFEYLPGVDPLREGEEVSTISSVDSVTIEEGGKSVHVTVLVTRQDQAVMRVRSGFFLQGTFTDYENTFSTNRELDMTISNLTAQHIAILRSRSWVLLDPCDLVGKTIVFHTTSASTWSTNGVRDTLCITGSIFVLSYTGKLTRIGRIAFETSHPSAGNVVMDFLLRHGRPYQQQHLLATPGWPHESTAEVMMPPNNRVYSIVSKDINPIHTNPVFAAYAQLPGTISHGMQTSAMVRSLVEQAVMGPEVGSCRAWEASFLAMVMPGDVLRVNFQHVAMLSGDIVVQVNAYNKNTNVKVLSGEAKFEQRPTAYLFTGQGSQKVGMGMELYEASAVAQECWDRGDAFFVENYGKVYLTESPFFSCQAGQVWGCANDCKGFSILDIVRNNPKELTIHFGGLRGRKLRDRYLNIKIPQSFVGEGDGLKPAIPGLSERSRSHTFRHESGLLFSTQFAQSAIMIMEIAAFEDFRARGLVQTGASYAGHSLGEYGALTCLGEMMPIESLLDLLFYRGSTIQGSISGDGAGQTGYLMVAINPSRIHQDFSENKLLQLVEQVSNRSGLLLEVVNFNVDGQQYVCAGHRKSLWVLSKVLDGMDSSTFLPADDVLEQHVNASQSMPPGLVLEPGPGFFPLKGIDIPFHSSVLRRNIHLCRKFIEKKLVEENIDPDKLVGKFIPNIVGKPFSLDFEYLSEVERITGNDRISELMRQHYLVTVEA